MSKIALIIGINDYENANSLDGCVNDAKSIAALVERNSDGSRNFDVKLLLSNPKKPINKKEIKKAVQELFAKRADMVLLYFAGHGTATNLGGYLCGSDAEAYDEGFPMQDLLSSINQSKIKECIVILDCCMSGALGEIPALGPGALVTVKEGTSILTASRRDESAEESDGSGLFTALVCDALSGSAADVLGVVTPAGVYSHVEQSFNGWDQRPLFKSYVSRSTCLRKTDPKVDLSILRKLPSFFTTADANHDLDPSYEFTYKKHIKANVAKFKELKKLQTAGLLLVNRKGDPDLYWACMESKSCRLSSLGKFYWHLAKESLL